MWNDAGSALDLIHVSFSFIKQEVILKIICLGVKLEQQKDKKKKKWPLRNPEKMHPCSFVQEVYFVNDHTVRTEVDESFRRKHKSIDFSLRLFQNLIGPLSRNESIKRQIFI